MSTLTKDQKIRMCALGIGYIYKHKKPGDEKRLAQGIKALADLIDDEEEAELKSLSLAVTKELLEKLKQKANAWPTMGEDKPDGKPDDYDPEDPFRSLSA